MNLTPEGYRQFFSNIDVSWLDYAQNLVNFNPELVSNPTHAGENAITQNATEWVTAHYTASYTNPKGPGSEPVGEMAVGRLIDFLSNRGRPCCAINFIIDRHGQVIQTAPYWAKLRHNPPYDGRTVGFEIEAERQSQITSKQYESAAYLTIAILQNSGLLNNRPLTEIFKGHGEMRDLYREQNPGTNLGQRNDFDEPIMNILRPKMDAFLQSTPQIAQLTQPLR